jgi:hypothetical protein
MKNLSKAISLLCLTSLLFVAISCGAGKDGAKDEKVVLTEKGKLLTSITWKLDPNATLKGTTDVIKDSTSITANIELKDDVKAIADFVAETVIFGIDKSDPSKLSYSRTIGEGLLSSSVLGYWNFNKDETAITMREWDSQLGKEKEPVTYNIVELSTEKLVIQKEGDSSPNIYFPKK